MQITNLSTIGIPRRFWQEIANELKVGGNLPDAVRDDLGMYGGCKSLRVCVRPRRRVTHSRVIMVGCYTYGRISLFPCTHCTAGFLTQVLLHELVHAWLHQYHDKLYFASCELAERFADAGFIALGGKITKSRVCGS
jgi:hypothetical protein